MVVFRSHHGFKLAPLLHVVSIDQQRVLSDRRLLLYGTVVLGRGCSATARRRDAGAELGDTIEGKTAPPVLHRRRVG